MCQVERRTLNASDDPPTPFCSLCALLVCFASFRASRLRAGCLGDRRIPDHSQMNETLSPTERRVVNIANGALLGHTVRITALNRCEAEAIRMILRPPWSNGDQESEALATRACVKMGQELRKKMPLVHVFIETSLLDGCSELRVMIPNPTDLRGNARVVSRKHPLPRALGWMSVALVVSATIPTLVATLGIDVKSRVAEVAAEAFRHFHLWSE